MNNHTQGLELRLLAAMKDDCGKDRDAAGRLIRAHDKEISSKSPQLLVEARSYTRGSIEDYKHQRRQILEREHALSFDARCRLEATALELRVDAIIQSLRSADAEHVYNAAAPRLGHAGQQHKRFPGDHFLSNSDLIGQTQLFDVAFHMPKGAQLHIHVGSGPRPEELLEAAKRMTQMFITSNLPLVPDPDKANREKCEIEFSIRSANEQPGNLFSENHKPGQWMQYGQFLHEYSRVFASKGEEWLADKLQFHEDEVHGQHQTVSGAWEKFNGRTRMTKGLINYVTGYREYMRSLLTGQLNENIQYLEIRQNFMASNHLFYDDGTGRVDNRGIMAIIIEEVEAFKQRLAQQPPGTSNFFSGLKVIYCLPRSFSPDAVKAGLDECITFKEEWPQWIAGFDLVGEEGKGRPLKDFTAQFLQFQRECETKGLDIPFLFHCGETLDMGTSTDQNLADALVLNTKRIAHGFALYKHPYLMQQVKAKGICLEICLISNEILGLAPRVSGHPMLPLLANNVHGTLNPDNPTQFRSLLSHEFYQCVVGSAGMGLPGWKQLILWSIWHSCMDENEKTKALAGFSTSWEKFLHWVIHTYEDVVGSTAMEGVGEDDNQLSDTVLA